MAYLALKVEDVVINKWEVVDDVLIIGRAKDCDIQIDDQSVSSKHARLVVEADPYLDDTYNVFIEDLKSTNGTELNGKAVSKQKLADGDTIKIGFSLFEFVNSHVKGLDDTAVIIS